MVLFSTLIRINGTVSLIWSLGKKLSFDLMLKIAYMGGFQEELCFGNMIGQSSVILYFIHHGSIRF